MSCARLGNGNNAYERSKGIRNPTFSLQILSGAQAAVDTIVVP
jgi:hypothetical protein